KGIELLRQRSVRIVAQELGIRPIDHANETFQPRFCKPLAQSLVTARPQVQKEAANAGIVTQAFIAVAMGWAHALDLHIAAPVGCRRYCTAVRSETDQRGIFPEALAAKLANIEFLPQRAHFGE